MLNYNSVIKNKINHESVSIKEISPVIKINVRGKKREFLTNIGKNLNMILPTEANTSSTSDKLTAIWLSPDEWMIVSNELASKDTNKYGLYEILFNSISKTKTKCLCIKHIQCAYKNLFIMRIDQDLSDFLFSHLRTT